MIRGHWQDWWAAIKYFISLLFVRPEEAKNHDVNNEIKKPPDLTETSPLPKPSAAEQLKTTALAWIGRDASPLNRAPQELSCAEAVVTLVNRTWPGTLDENIIDTYVLHRALIHSPRFHGVLDPVPGCIEISPRSGVAYGHVGIYVEADRIASNDSRTGKFERNYTRMSWRKTFIQGRGLKAYLFVPVDYKVV